MGEQYYVGWRTIVNRIINQGGAQHVLPNVGLTTDNPAREAAERLLAAFHYSLPYSTHRGGDVPLDSEAFTLNEHNQPTYEPDYKILNAALRSGDPARIEPVEQFQQELQASLKLLPPHYGVTYRGVKGLSAEDLAQYKVGATITERAFLSTTTDPRVAAGFAEDGDTFFVDESFSGRSLVLASLYDTESEVLFSSGTKWQVLFVDENPQLTFGAIRPGRIIYRREVPV